MPCTKMKSTFLGQMHSIVWLNKELKEDCEETASLQRQQMLNHGYQKPYIMPTSFREKMSCHRAASVGDSPLRLPSQ